MPGEDLHNYDQADPRALAIAAQYFAGAELRAEKRGIHTFVDVTGAAEHLDGLYIFDDINDRLINVIKRTDGSTAALGRTLPPLHSD